MRYLHYTIIPLPHPESRDCCHTFDAMYVYVLYSCSNTQHISNNTMLTNTVWNIEEPLGIQMLKRSKELAGVTSDCWPGNGCGSTSSLVVGCTSSSSSSNTYIYLFLLLS